jgi:hypothetical protein
MAFAWRPHNCSTLQVARPEGFEPPTNWFEASYSIHLSYGRFRKILDDGMTGGKASSIASN